MSFLQSPEWEEFQKSLGRKIWRVEGALVIRHDLPYGFNYLYCPRPETVTEDQLLVIKGLAREEKSIFLKIDPQVNFQFSIFNFQFSDPLQPRKTVVLDLQKSEEELLYAMHEKTRYNIRLAERRGVQIKNSQSSVFNFQHFWKLLEDTAGRDRFSTHERQYYQKLLEARSENFSSELFFAEYGDKLHAVALVNFYRGSTSIGSITSTGSMGRATYLHGASSRGNKEIMAPHLLHWRIIQEAKRRGMHYYDLWGVDEKKWPGVTRFKLGFGGEVIEYPESIDIVYRPPLYRIYKIIKHIRG